VSILDDGRIYLEQLIRGSFIRYEVLSSLIQYSYAGSNCTEINLFIDMNSVIKQLYSIDTWTYRHKNRYEITASMINMCAHYREFFRRIGVKTNIYIVYGLNCPTINDTLVQGYNAKFITAYIKKKDINELIADNLKILDYITQNIPGVYFFNCGTNEVSAMIYHLISTLRRPEVENIILSKDVLMLQLIPAFNARVLRPLKGKENGNSLDLSFIVDNNNLWEMFCKKYRDVAVPTDMIGTNFISNILAMTRVPERGLYAKLSIAKAFKILNLGIMSRYIDNNTFYTQSSINTVLEALDVECNKDELDLRYRAISTHHQANFVLLAEHPEFKRLRLVDLEDYDGLRSIVSTYFTDTPIELDLL
jgi:hypothetical protein